MGEWKSVGYICVYLTSQAAVKAVSTSMHQNLLNLALIIDATRDPIWGTRKKTFKVLLYHC